MDIFGERRITKGQLQRAAVVFGKLHAKQMRSDEHFEIINREVAGHKASTGGSWNYDDLFRCLLEIAKGGSTRDALSYFSGLKGAGEAESKTKLLREILRKTPLESGVSVSVGDRDVELGNSVILQISYDACFKHDGTVYCFWIYPRSTPLKQVAKKALIAEFAAPFEGMSHPHKLVFVESPKIGKSRCPAVELIEFDYYGLNQDFRYNLIECRLRMGDDIA